MNFWKNLLRLETTPTRGEQLHFRIFELFTVVSVINFAWQWGFYIQQIGEVVLPLGIAQYIDISFMFDNGISLVNAALMTLFCLLGFFRVFPRGAYAIAVLFFHLHYVSRFSLGEISHGSNFIGMSLLALALALFFFNEPRFYQRFAFGFLFFFMGIGYTSAGVAKLIGTGITWPDGAHLWLWIAERKVDVLSAGGTFSPNWIQELALENRFVSTLILTFGLLTEVLGFLLWFSKTRPYIATALIGMHIGVYISMNIMFGVYILELLILGYPWGRWFDKFLMKYHVPVNKTSYT
ncbi:MAG: hypothetical protein R3281_08940 [Balneolaceae bacterium]|nr:hypothetical protein [Balneolaceae bacterium]